MLAQRVLGGARVNTAAAVGAPVRDSAPANALTRGPALPTRQRSKSAVPMGHPVAVLLWKVALRHTPTPWTLPELGAG